MPYVVISNPDEDAVRSSTSAGPVSERANPASHPGMAAVRGYMQGVRQRGLDDTLSASSPSSGVPIPTSENGMTAVRGYLQGGQQPASRHNPSVSKAEVPDHFWGMGRAAAQGLTFGFADEIEARLATLSGPESYEEELKRVRGEIDRYRQAHPSVALGAEVAGSLPTLFMPAGAIARGASLAGRFGRGTAAAVKANRGKAGLAAEPASKTNFHRKAARGALTGGAVGGLADVGHGEGSLGDRVKSAGDGLVFGALAGVATPWVGRQITQQLEKRGLRLIPVSNRDLGDVPGLGDLRQEIFSRIRGLAVKPDALQVLHERLREVVNKTGREKDPSGQILEFVDGVGRLSKGDPVSLKHVVTRLRADLRSTRSDDHRKLNDILEGELDGFIQNLRVKDLAGPKNVGINRARAERKRNIEAAKSLFERLRKSQMLDDLETAAGRGSTPSKVREQFKNLAADKDLMARFKKVEQRAIRAAARGSIAEPVIHLAEILSKARFISRIGKRVLGTDGLSESVTKPLTRRGLDQTIAQIRTGRPLSPDIASLGNDRLAGMNLLAMANAQNSLPAPRRVEEPETRYAATINPMTGRFGR